MKLMRLAMCVAAFALVGKIAMAEDMDVRALQAKLAAQEARLNDLQAKMYGAACDEKVVADGLTSLRKNAVLTIGGTVNTRYFYRSGKIESALNNVPNDNNRRKVADFKYGDFRVSDAKLEAKIDVNEYFDAYLKMDLQDGDFNRAGVAQNYWIRWKNVCNTGFGLLVGRDTLKFGGIGGPGQTGGWTKNYDGLGDAVNTGVVVKTIASGEGMFSGNSMVPAHTIWDNSRTTQITPYWESQDGALKAELSLIQAVDTRHGLNSRVDPTGTHSKYRSVNYGLGSGTFRLTWKPIEGLKLVASAMNLYAKNGNGSWNWRQGHTWTAGPVYNQAITNNAIEMDNSNTSINLGFEYRPCFVNRLKVWANYTHGWNENWVKDQDSDVLSYGFTFDITDQFTFFAQGDWMKVKNDQGNVWHKASGWAASGGVMYVLPYGVNMEAGYRHETLNYKARNGFKHTKAKADTFYAQLGFNF